MMMIPLHIISSKAKASFDHISFGHSFIHSVDAMFCPDSSSSSYSSDAAFEIHPIQLDYDSQQTDRQTAAAAAMVDLSRSNPLSLHRLR